MRKLVLLVALIFSISGCGELLSIAISQTASYVYVEGTTALDDWNKRVEKTSQDEKDKDKQGTSESVDR